MDRKKAVRKVGILLAAFLVLSFATPFSTEHVEEKTVVFASNADVFYTLLATPIAFMKSAPLLIFAGDMGNYMTSFLSSYGTERIISVGAHMPCSYPKEEFVGNITSISFQIAREFYGGATKAVVLPHDMAYYNLSLLATQISCYEGIPLIFYEGNPSEISEELQGMGIEEAISVIPLNISGIHDIPLINEKSLYGYLTTLRNFSYMAVTNPHDAIIHEPVEKDKISYQGHISNLKITLFAREVNILGNDSQFFELELPDGFNFVKIFINASSSGEGLPNIIDASVYRGEELVTYSFSNAWREEKCYLQFPANNAGGKYTIKVSIYRGIKGGFFSQRGISMVDTDFDVDIIISSYDSPCYPSMPLSSLAPYLASMRGGIVMPAENEIMDKEYKFSLAGGAWNHPEIHSFVNGKVNRSVEKIENLMRSYGLDIKYIALVGDVNMLPRYYYKSSTGDSYVGYGIPSDNPYSLNFSVAVGRIMGMSIEDVSLMLSRELFYSSLAGEEWSKKFNFITGEGFGETAAIFHQIPYSRELRKYGFETEVFGILRNGRERLEKENAFHAGFVEYEGHGDWYWMLSSIYGMDYYSRVVDVAHVRNYAFPPNIILTAACLMGRMDGIAPESSISMAFLHAGSVAVVSATRETGGEATLEIIENEIIFNASSIGKAVMKSNSITGPPTKYARVLYGDPAFVPMLPE